MPEKATADGEDALYAAISSSLPALLEKTRRYQLSLLAYCRELDWLKEKIRCCLAGASVLGDEKHRSNAYVRDFLFNLAREGAVYKLAAREEGYTLFTQLCKARLQCAGLLAAYMCSQKQQSTYDLLKRDMVIEFAQAVDALLPQQLLCMARLGHLLSQCDQVSLRIQYADDGFANSPEGRLLSEIAVIEARAPVHFS